MCRKDITWITILRFDRFLQWCRSGYNIWVRMLIQCSLNRHTWGKAKSFRKSCKLLIMIHLSLSATFRGVWGAPFMAFQCQAERMPSRLLVQSRQMFGLFIWGMKSLTQAVLQKGLWKHYGIDFLWWKVAFVSRLKARFSKK